MKIPDDFNDEMMLVDKKKLEDYLNGIDAFLSNVPYGWEEFVSKECIEGYKHLRKMLK
jgi:hypothetical protein